MGSREALTPERRRPRREIAHRLRINLKTPPFFHWTSRCHADQKSGQMYIFFKIIKSFFHIAKLFPHADVFSTGGLK
jgi:hypothetical protein